MSSCTIQQNIGASPQSNEQQYQTWLTTFPDPQVYV
uniref:Uncharacterized protein n=1 Tax=Anguilla anguilla TaxID=7936 RepID=A0A0E9Q7B7_ANGAN